MMQWELVCLKSGIKVTHMKKILVMMLLIVAVVTATISLSPKIHASLTSNQYDVDVVVVSGDSLLGVDTTQTVVEDQTYGGLIQIDLSSFLDENNEFVYFIVNGEVIEDVNHSFLVTSNLNIVAILKPTTELVAVFLDTNGKYIDANYLVSGNMPSAPDVSAYSKPGYVVNSSENWIPAVSVLTDNQMYMLSYVIDETTTYNIGVTNATASNLTPVFNEVVIVTGQQADGYWMDGDEIVAYGQTYMFSALSDRNLTFVSSSDLEEVKVSIQDVSGIRMGYESYLAQLFIPSGYSIIEYGFIFDDQAYEITLENADQMMMSSVKNGYHEFLRSVDENMYDAIRAYAVFDHNGTIETIYSDETIYHTSDGYLEEITLDGASLDAFDPLVFEYYVVVDPLATVFPTIDTSVFVDSDTVNVVTQALPGYATITVTTFENIETIYYIYAEAENTDALETPNADVNFDQNLELIGSTSNVWQSTSEHLNGTSSLYMDHTHSAWISISLFGGNYPQIGGEYSIGMWLYVEAGATGTFNVELKEKENDITVYSESFTSLDEGYWVYIETDSLDQIISENASYLQIVLLNSTGVDVYVDALRVIEIESAAAVLVDTPYTVPNENLDFEELDEWDFYIPTNEEISYHTSIYHDGIQSLKITSGSIWNNIDFGGAQYPVKGDTVKLGFYVYVDSATASTVAGITIKLLEKEGAVSGDGIIISYTTSDLEFAFDTWVYIETEVATISNDPNYLQIVIEEGTDGTIYVDGVVLIETP